MNLSESVIRAQAERDGYADLSTGVAILREDRKILLVRRAVGDSQAGSYELPGGAVEMGETILDGAIREVREETGLTVARVLARFKGFDCITRRGLPVRQINLLVEAEPGGVVLKPDEHDHFVWVGDPVPAGIQMSDRVAGCVDEAWLAVKSLSLPALHSDLKMVS